MVHFLDDSMIASQTTFMAAFIIQKHFMTVGGFPDDAVGDMTDQCRGYIHIIHFLDGGCDFPGGHSLAVQGYDLIETSISFTGSNIGYVSAENHHMQAVFRRMACGFEENAEQVGTGWSTPGWPVD